MTIIGSGSTMKKSPPAFEEVPIVVVYIFCENINYLGTGCGRRKPKQSLKGGDLMPNLFARQTALTDVCGRLDYISNPVRQENLLSTYDNAADLLDGQYWEILAKESQAAFTQHGEMTRRVKDKKTGEIVEKELSCVEAREMIMLVGNELLNRMSPDEILKTAVDTVSEMLGRPVFGALHLNKSTSSLHIHLIYAERELLKEPVVKVAERNLFFDAQGKRHYKKSEILDENKQLLPGCRIVKKGEVYENRCFGAADPKFSRKGWLKKMKTDCILALRNGELKGDIEITEYDPSTGMLPQQYIGKAVYEQDPELAERISRYNADVREYNAAVRMGWLSHDEALMVQGYVNGSADKHAMLSYYLQQINERRDEDLDLDLDLDPEPKPLSALVASAQARSPVTADGNWEGAYWQRYKDIRDRTWEAFIYGQRREFKAIQNCWEARKDLDYRNSHVVYDRAGNAIDMRLNSRRQLAEAGYFDARDRIKANLQKHKNELATQRKYQSVAKGRQQIVRSLLLAGADEATVKSAMREYEAAMRLLQMHAQDPDYDFEHRRLKAAQTSLALARGRADRYIKQLQADKLEETSRLEIQTEQEYRDFQANGTVSSSDVVGDPGREPELEMQQTDR